jgi:hypothetical protein
MTRENDMWLPTPIYERIPQFWLLLGLLFMTSGTYLGFDYALSFLYFGVGFICAAWSLWIFSMRATARKEAREEAYVPPPAAGEAQAEPARQTEQHENVDHGAQTPA